MRSRQQRRRLALMRLVAVLCAALGFADLALDAGCDPLSAPGATDGVVTAPDGSADAGDERCATACVPDCFCCSRTLVRGSAIMPATLGLVTATPEAAPTAAPAGVRPVPYHPPLSRA